MKLDDGFIWGYKTPAYFLFNYLFVEIQLELVLLRQLFDDYL